MKRVVHQTRHVQDDLAMQSKKTPKS